jgi:hypothetical protein
VWIDPGEVSYKIGEHGSICHVPLDATLCDNFEPEYSTGSNTNIHIVDNEVDCDSKWRV